VRCAEQGLDAWVIFRENPVHDNEALSAIVSRLFHQVALR
jgi:hypothetical protein